MSITLGEKLKIRSMIYVAAEPIPFFWPMRSFIHHNPLHGLEHLPFPEAAAQGSQIFHGRSFLPRKDYQDYLKQGRVDQSKLSNLVNEFVEQQPKLDGIDLNKWLFSLLTKTDRPVMLKEALLNAADIHAVNNSGSLPDDSGVDFEKITRHLDEALLDDRPVYESVDALFGTKMADDLDELMVKSCLDFFDEGQSVWAMPKRELGLFSAWRNLARHNIRFFLRGIRISDILKEDSSPEGIISYVMKELDVPVEHWTRYFTRELARLHGWAGFIRWRSSATHYHWSQQYPGDLVDFIAIRMTLALALLKAKGRHNLSDSRSKISDAIQNKTMATFLQYEFHSRKVLPQLAQQVDHAISKQSDTLTQETFELYIEQKRLHIAQKQLDQLQQLASQVGELDAFNQLSMASLEQLLTTLGQFEQQEGMLWLRSMEAYAMTQLTDGIKLVEPVERDKRPFVQALFCIDTRSERIRRHLEAIGDYETYGIAGFFGIPVSFMEFGKGSETHLCPVILTPKNLVLEVTTEGYQEDDAALTALEKAMHELKQSVLSPFVTVEAIGLLFGLDMIGKTMAPKKYNTWRNKHLHEAKPETLMLLDKLSREQADSVVRTVQRTVIIKAVEQELGFSAELITDDMIRGLRECAMDNDEDTHQLAQDLNINQQQLADFIERLQNAYRINTSFAHMQLEQLGRIGFSLDEQANMVAQALSAIGLTKAFSRFILVMGHGSFSENNPYESALDCGACGGNHGIVSARVIAQMGNKPEVRKRLEKSGIHIPDDAWFVPGLHNTTTDELKLYDIEKMPPSHLFYLDRLRNGLVSASHLTAHERLPSLQHGKVTPDATEAFRIAQRNSMDWSQVRPEWGLSGNAYFIIGRRELTQEMHLDGRAFLHSYDYTIDPKLRLLENIITGPLVVGQWINMEHYFSAVDNENFGSGSKAYHNVAGRFGVMTGNQSDLRTGLPSQTVLHDGKPYHQPIRLITLIEAPIAHAQSAIDSVVSVKKLVQNGWIRLMIIDPETGLLHTYEENVWHSQPLNQTANQKIA